MSPSERAAQFLYLNRSCWNGLYRVNRNGDFNVPIGTKNTIVFPDDDFAAISHALRNATINIDDFERTIAQAADGDFVFADPPYTVAHNNNGFVKYNENIFSWSDQLRLKDACCRAVRRGAMVYITNANHQTIVDLYRDVGNIQELMRESVIGGDPSYRGPVSEIGVFMRPDT